MRKILIAACVLLTLGLHAQPICGFDDLHEKLLKSDPSYSKMLRSTDEFIRDYVASHPNTPKVTGLGTALYVIPIVVHIVHTGGEVGSVYNPSDATVLSTIDYLNQVYDGTAPGLAGGVGDIQIQFQLAKRDPNCNPTNGIDRVNGSSISGYVANGVNRNNSNGADELTVKNSSRWNTSDYYNIWVVNKIDGVDGTSGQFIAGFAYFPGTSSLYDGTIMLATQFTYDNKVLPHEIGHAFNLYHPFQGSTLSTQCPVNNNCSLDGDRICDTDPVSQNVTSGGVSNFTCRTGTNPCTNTSYSINTERNIMGYTNCFTLFTAGQKARMLASMALSSRASLANSLGGTATFSGASQCAPKINFEVGAAAVTESTVSTADCRGYKDYTYNMVIGNTPTATATATLQLSGTATQGVDYIITSNGNFASPSNTITFPSGNRDNRSFSIRIFDDGAIETTENIIINFTVNSGGGNAAKGEGIATQTVTINNNDVAPLPNYPFNQQIGNYSINLGSGTNGSAPFNAKLAAQKTTMLYRASELSAAGIKAGNITEFGIFLNKNSTRAFTNLRISMGLTSVPNLIDGGYYAMNVSTVKTLASYSTVNGLNNFVLDAPFIWDGVSNISVQICFDNGTAAASDLSDVSQAYSDGGSSTQGNIYFASVGCATAYDGVSYFGNGYKPVAKFVGVSPGPQVETALNATGSAYLGPFDDVYFYSAQGNVLARIKNLTAFDYGCTQVIIDRSGTGAKNYTSTNAQDAVADKTILISPTNNNPNGSYELTLYYKQAEITGWQNATGLQWSAAKILKTPDGVSAYVQGQVPSGLVTAADKTSNSYGTDAAITAGFTNGFSGFAVGNPALATNIFTFIGNGLWTNVSNWSSSKIPPAVLPQGGQIIIDPQQGGQCILNVAQTIQPGATLKVNTGKIFVIQGDLKVQQ